MYDNINKQKLKQFLLTAIKEELRIENRKYSKEMQKQRESVIEYSALAILLYNQKEAIKLIDSFLERNGGHKQK